jgi:hypothetical protein
MMKAERPEALTCAAALAAAADDVSHMLGARASEGSSDACPFFLGSSETTLSVSLKQCSSISTLAETLVDSTASSD